MDSALFLILPFLQLGFSYWISIQVAFTVMVLVRIYTLIVRGIQKNFAMKAGAVLLMFLPLLTSLSSSTVWDFFRTGREALFFMILVAVVEVVKGRMIFPAIARMERMALIMVAGLTTLILVQAVFLARNIYFGVPASFSLGDFGTIPDSNTLTFASGNIRPMATFNEPSYCGFILFSVFLMFCRRTAQSRNAKIIVAIIVLDALILRSLSFLGALAIVAGFVYFKRIRARRVIPLLAAGLLLLPFAIRFGQLGLLIGRLSDPNDYSTFARTGVPSIIMLPYLLAHPLGVPASRLVEVLYGYTAQFGMAGDEILQNAIFNMFFLYGVPAVYILFVVLRGGGDIVTKLFLLFCANFNGGFFTIDKIGVMCFAICCYETSKVASSRKQALHHRRGELERVAAGAPASSVVNDRRASPA